MIVKIQRSQPPSPSGFVLVYTESRDYWWQGVMDSNVDAWMGDRQKDFAYAHIEGTEFVIESRAPWQDW